MRRGRGGAVERGEPRDARRTAVRRGEVGLVKNLSSRRRKIPRRDCGSIGLEKFPTRAVGTEGLNGVGATADKKIRARRIMNIGRADSKRVGGGRGVVAARVACRIDGDP